MSKEPNISELCRIIRETVGNAVNKAANSYEVHEIKQTVKSVAREVTEEISGQVRRGIDSASRNIPPRVYQTQPAEEAPPQSNPHNDGRDSKAPEVSGVPVWRGSVTGMQIKGNVMSFLGVVGATAGVAMLGIAALVAARVVVDVTTAIAYGMFSLIPLVMVVAFTVLAKHGINLYGTAGRYKRYLTAIGDDRFCPIAILAESVQKKSDFVVKDLQRMIKLGMFPEGQLDAGKSCLILDMDTYRQYLTAEERMEQCRREKEAAAVEAAQPDKPKSDLDAALADGKEYIRRMRLANDLIEGEEISGKIDRIEQVSRKIFDFVEQHPEKLPDIRRFMSYYLPITLKLLEGYCKFDAQPVQGENITAAKKEIEETLDTVIKAFENLLDGLFQMEVMDISSDISTLEAMLAQEGLMDSDFKTQK